MRNSVLLLVSLLFLFAGCKKETQLGKSVFINDPEYTDLPAYSEWGYNTFGAYYDREAFISNNDVVPAKVIVTNNLTSFILSGQLGDGGYYSTAYDKMTIAFKISGFLPSKYAEMVSLNDSILDLKNPAYQVVITKDTTNYSATILNGQLEFKRAQNLLVDTKQVEVILSGYFEFQALVDKMPITVSNGRFDVGIGYSNFYNY
jgi:hypothetical protein